MSRRSLLICLLAVSCSEQKFSSIDGSADGDGPELRVTPSLIDFGGLSQDDEPVTEQFDIISVGGSPVDIESLAIQSDVASFTILTEGIAGTTLLPGEMTTVDVMFEPMAAYEQRGQAVITSNVDFPPELAVELVGSGTIPELQISPDPLNMGTTYIGCAAREVELKNVGTDTLQIYDVDQEGESFSMTNSLDLPLTLEPDESVTVYLEFEPYDIGEVEGSLVVQSNEPLGTREGLHVGTGDFAASYEDEFLVPEEPPSDIIFYVDQSGSMSDDQARLASNFSTFINELATYSTDWQIIVANADNGCNAHGGVLRPEMVDYESRFQSAVSSGGGFWTEAGLTITSEAVEKTDAGECNWGFLRPDAMLQFMVSDEPSSPAAHGAGTWTRSWPRRAAQRTWFSAIAGDYPGGCALQKQVTATTNPSWEPMASSCPSARMTTPENLAMLAAASVQMAAFEVTTTRSSTSASGLTAQAPHWVHYDEDDSTVVFDEHQG